MSTTITLANSLTLGQPYLDSSGVTWWHRAVSGWRDGTPMKTSYTDRPGAPGAYDGPAYPDKRVVVLTGTIRAPSHLARLQAMQRLRGYGATGALLSLKVTDELGALEAMVRRSDKPTMTMSGAFDVDYSLQFTAADPRLFAAAQSVSTQMAQSGAGGIGWNGTPAVTGGAQWNGPTPGNTGIAWGQPTAGGVIPLDNRAGTADADPLFTITGPCVNPAVSTSTNWIVYNGSLAASDVLVIDTAAGAALLNGVNRRPLLSRADWFTIPAGQLLDVRFTADVQNALAFMTATWRVSYL